MDQKVIDFGTGYSKRPVRRRSVFENNEWSVPLYRVKSTGNNESLGSFHIDLEMRGKRALVDILIELANGNAG
jgi:hypothetical protein